MDRVEVLQHPKVSVRQSFNLFFEFMKFLKKFYLKSSNFEFSDFFCYYCYFLVVVYFSPRGRLGTVRSELERESSY